MSLLYNIIKALKVHKCLQADYSKSKDGAAYEKRAFKGRIKLRPFMFYNVGKWRIKLFPI